jgi:enoyl-CoA hydratase
MGKSDLEPGVAVSIEPRDGRFVAHIVVNNPARLNILTASLARQLTTAVRSLGDNGELAAVVLTGAGGRAFIGGADISEMALLDSSSARIFISHLHQACAALRELPVPVIARISGYCLGAGLEIAISCDLRVAADHSTFGLPEVRVGIPSVIEAALLPRLIGWGKTAELVYTGESISASQALDCGLIERVVRERELDAAVEQWTGAILNSGSAAVRLQKTLLKKWESLPLDDAIDAGIESFARAYQTDEPRRLMNKFLQRERKPRTTRSTPD